MKIIHKVPLALSKCLSMWIKVDKYDYLKISSRDFKNSFYFGIVSVPSIPGMHQKLCLVFWPFRSRSKQCEIDVSYFRFKQVPSRFLQKVIESSKKNACWHFPNFFLKIEMQSVVCTKRAFFATVKWPPTA